MEQDVDQTRLAREAALGRVADGLWHETLNLLTVAGFWAKNLDKEPPGASPAERLVTALDGLTRLVKAQQACWAGALRGRREPFDARTLVDVALDLARPRLSAAGIDATMRLPDHAVAVEGCFGEGVLSVALALGRVARSGGAACASTLELELEAALGSGILRLSGKCVEASGLADLDAEGDAELTLVTRLAEGASLRLVYG
jgi:hypothetical protein